MFVASQLTQSLNPRDTLFLLKLIVGRRSIRLIRPRILVQLVVGKRLGLAILILWFILFRFVVRHDEEAKEERVEIIDQLVF